MKHNRETNPLHRLLASFEKFKTLLLPFARGTNIDVLLAKADAKLPLRDRIAWLQDLFAWLRSPVGSSEKESLKGRGGSRIQSVRLRFLFHLLERHPHWKEQVAATFRSILSETSGLELFSSTGLASQAGLVSEAANRLSARLLPAPSDERDLALLFKRIFHAQSDAEWIENLSHDTFSKLIDLCQFGALIPGMTFAPLRADMIDALLILGANIASLGLAPELRARMPSAAVADSPFRNLNNHLQFIVANLKSGVNTADPHGYFFTTAAGDIKNCRERIGHVYRHLEESGISVALVFKLESLSGAISRIETLLFLLFSGHAAFQPAADGNALNGFVSNQNATAQAFLASLVKQSVAARGFRSLIRTNLDMLARKIVERVGASGEHYITTTRDEYWSMLKAGAGGGLITVGTTIIKFVVSAAHLALFFEGFFFWVTYSGSFLLMQWFGFALATKQPSMTASALANKLRMLSNRRHLQEFVDEVARITRSQFAAAVGNVGLVVPAALLTDMLFARLAGHPILDAAHAHQVLHSLNPLKSLTIPAAALTGVLLWLAAVTGGWVENWAVYRRLPEAIQSHRRLLAIFGEVRTQQLARAFMRGIAAFGSNMAIGFYLAFTPIIGRFFGLPLEIRHVTLSSGSLTFAIHAIGLDALNWKDFAMACLGIVFILLLNFGVSFSLAMFVALRARRIKRAWIYHLLLAVRDRLRTRTTDFFFPNDPA